MLKVFKKIFGDKYEKELKLLWPIVEEINVEYEKLKNISDDELKAKTEEFKQKIQDYTKETKDKLDELKAKLQSDEDFDRQAVHDEVDKLNEQLNDEYEEILDELLPEAFAVIKSTCERLVGKSWTAAGNKINWEMIPPEKVKHWLQRFHSILMH
jgi:preprotein translocase subunit SecA